MNILERLWFKAKTGAEIVDLGQADETVIRFKDKYISVLEDKNGEIKSLGWSDDPTMFTVPIRDFWTAKPNKKGLNNE